MHNCKLDSHVGITRPKYFSNFDIDKREFSGRFADAVYSEVLIGRIFVKFFFSLEFTFNITAIAFANSYHDASLLAVK